VLHPHFFEKRSPRITKWMAIAGRDELALQLAPEEPKRKSAFAEMMTAVQLTTPLSAFASDS